MTEDAPRFRSKTAARTHAWDRLQDEGLARLPFPPHGRIPNFAGAQAAARRLFEIPVYRDAHCIKVNPDSPQKHVRAHALHLGISVLVPTPKLRDGFHLLDPRALAPADYGKAATRSTMHQYSRVLALDEVPTVDAIVTGCAAVTPEGHRCGKGAGYSDIEWGVLMELGQAPVPVATTVHDVQVLGGFPSKSHDLVCTGSSRRRERSRSPRHLQARGASTGRCCPGRTLQPCRCSSSCVQERSHQAIRRGLHSAVRSAC